MKKNVLILLIILYSIFFHNIAQAKHIKLKKHTNKEAYLVLDQQTGKILFSKYAHEKRYPASLTKMMTLYNVFEAVKHKKLYMNQRIRTSSYAASKPSCKLGLKHGEELTVKEAILSLIVKSANDSAVVLAEAVSGSESKFVTKMNAAAKKIGMKSTNFANASGLYHKNQYSTALDMAKLAIALKRDFPEYYNLFSRIEFEYKGRIIKSHNNVTRIYPGAKGMKTGYINASGFNLVTTAERGNKHLIGVVLGGKTQEARDYMMISMLDKHFNSYKMPSTLLAKNTTANNNLAAQTSHKATPMQPQTVSQVDQIAQIIENVEAEEVNNLSQFNVSSPSITEKTIKRAKIPTPFLKSKLNRAILRQVAAK